MAKRRAAGPRDWHPEDVKAAVRKTGTTLYALSRANGLPEHACRHALRYPYLAAEVAIGRLLGVPPQEIWPSRYKPDGTRLRRLPRAEKSIPATHAATTQIASAA